jgi:hypothetical protein
MPKWALSVVFISPFPPPPPPPPLSPTLAYFFSAVRVYILGKKENISFSTLFRGFLYDRFIQYFSSLGDLEKYVSVVFLMEIVLSLITLCHSLFPLFFNLKNVFTSCPCKLLQLGKFKSSTEIQTSRDTNIL